MSKEIKVGNCYHASYCKENKEIYCADYDIDAFMWFSKQDLLNMLSLCEEEKTE